MTLHPVRGHEGVRLSLGRARSRGTLPTALLLHGPAGVGKQRIALWTAQLLLCEAAGETPCGECRSCRMALRLEHPDLHWYFPLARPKGSSSSPEKLADALEDARGAELAELRVSAVRPTVGDEARAIYLVVAQALRHKARSRPAMSSVQVFILAQAETLVPQESSPEAANALLKLLEEPPEDTFFILTSGEPGRLLPTIRSRTVPLHLSPLSDGEVRDFLVDVAGADPDDAAKAAAMGQGSIGRALGFLPDETEEDRHGPLDKLRRKTYRLLQAALDALLAGMPNIWVTTRSSYASSSSVLATGVGATQRITSAASLTCYSTRGHVASSSTCKSWRMCSSSKTTHRSKRSIT
ncbi:MAG: hypothetical protein KY453_13140, partial [Gemmatimonadetes bacterium]|nr:hypothetical protein [Gemmatimonadota bacterium]